ncbi:MAG: fatty acid desaturase [Acidobacteria bacterium]|nr:fatty acid desaturase [Acidobacteriota bacterium]
MAFHILALASYAVAFWIFLHPAVAGLDRAPEMLAFVAAAGLMLGWISGVDVGVNFHNHVHRRVFRADWLNRWFGRLWTFSGGWPSYYWEHSHLLHHERVLDPTDWTLPRRRKNGEWENLFVYSLAHWPWRYARHLWHDFTSGTAGPGTGRRAAIELAWFAAFWSIPFLVDPLMALALWVFPQFVANIAVMGPGMYAQHFGCHEPTADEPYSHSNTFLSRFFNLTMFNIGYHIEHHQHPLVHWSALPRLHEQWKGRLAAGGAHVVPFGYYRGGQLLSALFGGDRGRHIFLRQHPDYRPARPAPAAAPEATGTHGR